MVIKMSRSIGTGATAVEVLGVWATFSCSLLMLSDPASYNSQIRCTLKMIFFFPECTKLCYLMDLTVPSSGRTAADGLAFSLLVFNSTPRAIF